MVFRNLSSQELTYSRKCLEDDQELSPNVEREIRALLECSKRGGAFGDKYYLNLVNQLVDTIIERIKEKKIIEEDKDIFYDFLEQCKNSAINGVKIEESEINYWARVADTYLKYKEYGQKGAIKARYSLESLCDSRAMMLKRNYRICDNVSKMFDYIEAVHRENEIIPLTERFKEVIIFDYYYNCPQEEKHQRKMQDLKLYIYPQEYKNAVESCEKNMDQKDVDLYIKIFILLEYNVPFEEIYNFIEREISPSLLEIMIKEIVKYSRNGIDFYKFIAMKQNRSLTKEEENLFELIIERNKEYDQELAKKKSTKDISDYSGSLYETTYFDSTKAEYDFLINQREEFRVADILMSSEDIKGVFLITRNDYYALSGISDCNNVLYRCMRFDLTGDSNVVKDFISDEALQEISSEQQGKMFQEPSSRIFFKFEIIDRKLRIKYFLPERINEFQKRVLQELDSDLIKIRNHYLEYIQIENLNIKAKNRACTRLREIEKCQRKIDELILDFDIKEHFKEKKKRRNP